MPVARLACFPDLPQGLPKKIELHLLLPDLALQLCDAFARARYIPHLHGLRLRRKLDSPGDLPRATRRPQRLSSAAAEMSAPLEQQRVAPRQNSWGSRLDDTAVRWNMPTDG